MELDLNKQLELNDTGVYFIPDSTLIRLHPEKAREIENRIEAFAAAHPEFAFYISRDQLGGIKISWERRAR
jgi:hypothetical protein